MGRARIDLANKSSKVQCIAVVEPDKTNPVWASAPVGSDGHAIDVFTSLDDVRERIDAVCICTPTDTHCDLIRQAVAGRVRHVFCEAPIAWSEEDVRACYKHCNERGAFLFCGWFRRFDTEFTKMYDFYQGSHLVSAKFVDKRCGRPRENQITSSITSEITSSPSGKHLESFREHLAHDINLALMFMNDQAPVGVQVVARDTFGTGSYDNAYCNLEYPGGKSLLIELSQFSKRFENSIRIVADGEEFVCGKKDIIFPDSRDVENRENSEETVSEEACTERHYDGERYAEAMALQMDHFAEICRKEKVQLRYGRDACTLTAQVVQLAEKSVLLGAKVFLSEEPVMKILQAGTCGVAQYVHDNVLAKLPQCKALATCPNPPTAEEEGHLSDDIARALATPEINGVYVCLPPKSKVACVEACLAQRKKVLCQTPVPEYFALHSLAVKNDSFFMIDFPRRFDKKFIRAKEKVTQIEVEGGLFESLVLEDSDPCLADSVPAAVWGALVHDIDLLSWLLEDVDCDISVESAAPGPEPHSLVVVLPVWLQRYDRVVKATVRHVGGASAFVNTVAVNGEVFGHDSRKKKPRYALPAAQYDDAYACMFKFFAKRPVNVPGQGLFCRTYTRTFKLAERILDILTDEADDDTDAATATTAVRNQLSLPLLPLQHSPPSLTPPIITISDSKNVTIADVVTTTITTTTSTSTATATTADVVTAAATTTTAAEGDESGSEDDSDSEDSDSDLEEGLNDTVAAVATDAASLTSTAASAVSISTIIADPTIPISDKTTGAATLLSPAMCRTKKATSDVPLPNLQLNTKSSSEEKASTTTIIAIEDEPQITVAKLWGTTEATTTTTTTTSSLSSTVATTTPEPASPQSGMLHTPRQQGLTLSPRRQQQQQKGGKRRKSSKQGSPSPGIIRQDGIAYKPLTCDENALGVYEHIQSHVPALAPFVPRITGRLTVGGNPCIAVEDVAQRYKRPAYLDLKLGEPGDFMRIHRQPYSMRVTRHSGTRDPDALPISKHQQSWNDLAAYFRDFLRDRRTGCTRYDVIPALVAQLRAIYAVFETQTSLRMRAASLRFIYESSEASEAALPPVVRLVDLARVKILGASPSSSLSSSSSSPSSPSQSPASSVSTSPSSSSSLPLLASSSSLSSLSSEIGGVDGSAEDEDVSLPVYASVDDVDHFFCFGLLNVISLLSSIRDEFVSRHALFLCRDDLARHQRPKYRTEEEQAHFVADRLAHEDISVVVAYPSPAASAIACRVAKLLGVKYVVAQPLALLNGAQSMNDASGVTGDDNDPLFDKETSVAANTAAVTATTATSPSTAAAGNGAAGTAVAGNVGAEAFALLQKAVVPALTVVCSKYKRLAVIGDEIVLKSLLSVLVGHKWKTQLKFKSILSLVPSDISALGWVIERINVPNPFFPKTRTSN